MYQNQIRAKEKFSFALANIGNIPIMTLISTYLLIFYTDVVGLDPASVATLLLIARIFDGLNDPIVGYFVDHMPRTKLGHFRSILLWGSVICGINFILLWFGPVWAPAGKMAVVYITYLLLGITFDIMDIPLNSMIPVMTDEEKERNSLSVIKGISYTIGGIVIGVGAPLVLANTKTPLDGYYILIFLSTAVVIGFSIIGTMGIHERVGTSNNQEKYKLKDIFSIIFVAPVLFAAVTALLYGIGNNLMSSSMLYFVTYVLDDKIELISIFTVLSVIGMLPAMMFSGMLANRFGKNRIYTLGLIIAGISTLIPLVNVTNIPLLAASTIINRAGIGLFTTLMYGIQADNVDYIDYKRNQRAEGALASINSFVLKAGGGIGGAISGYMLASTGYVANTAQTETAKLGIIANAIILPGILFLLGGIAFGLGYKINKVKLAQITQTLRSRRQNVI